MYFAGTWSWCPGYHRGAETLSQQEKKISADVQQNRASFARMQR
jgi:hypothetical protein